MQTEVSPSWDGRNKKVACKECLADQWLAWLRGCRRPMTMRQRVSSANNCAVGRRRPIKMS
ncbi:hypothetical protein [Hallella colorans]|uniref:hypothetical protein n=1 Tax=Hallella colorans TaxID=1703337 RepID=UPI0035CF48EA